MNRIGDWEKALAQYVASVEREPFAFGSTDCALFAAGAILAMTGEDLAAEFRGKYRSHAGSVRALAEEGFSSLEEVMDAKLPETPIGYARRGDIVLLSEEDDVGSLGIVIGDVALFTLAQEGEAGLARIPRALWEKAWAVG